MRISPSQIKTFRKEPLLWCFKYFFGLKGPDNAKMAAGRAAGTAVQCAAIGERPWNLVEDDASRLFQMDRKREWEDCPNPCAMAEQLRIAIKPLGVASGMEVELKGQIHGVDILGFADLVYEDFGLEIKTSARLTKELTSDEKIQCGVYQYLLGKPIKLVRATEQKVCIITPEPEILTKAVFFVGPVIESMRPYLEALDDHDFERKLRLTRSAHVNDPDGYWWTQDTLGLAELLYQENHVEFHSRISALSEQGETR